MPMENIKILEFCEVYSKSVVLPSRKPVRCLLKSCIILCYSEREYRSEETNLRYPGFKMASGFRQRPANFRPCWRFIFLPIIQDGVIAIFDQSINQSINPILIRLYPHKRGGQIYPTLTAISPIPTFHLTRFKASSFSKPIFLPSSIFSKSNTRSHFSCFFPEGWLYNTISLPKKYLLPEKQPRLSLYRNDSLSFTTTLFTPRYELGSRFLCIQFKRL